MRTTILSFFLFLCATSLQAQDVEKASDDAFEDKSFVAMDQTTTGSVSFGWRMPFGQLADHLDAYPELGARVGTTLDYGLEVGLGLGLGFKADGTGGFEYYNDFEDEYVTVSIQRSNGFRPYISKKLIFNENLMLLGTLGFGFELHQVADITKTYTDYRHYSDLNVYTINPEVGFYKSISEHVYLGGSVGALVGNYSFHKHLPEGIGWGSWMASLAVEFR